MTGTKDISFDNGDNAKGKGVIKTSDKTPNFNNSDKEVANEPWVTSANVSLKDI